MEDVRPRRGLRRRRKRRAGAIELSCRRAVEKIHGRGASEHGERPGFGPVKTRRDIVKNWLPRYTGLPLNKFGEYILLTNFQQYVKLFAHWNRVPVMGKDRPMPNAT